MNPYLKLIALSTFALIITFLVTFLGSYRRRTIMNNPETLKAYLTIEKNTFVYKLLSLNFLILLYLLIMLVFNSLGYFVLSKNFVLYNIAVVSIALISSVLYSILIYNKKHKQYKSDITNIIENIDQGTGLPYITRMILKLHNKYFGLQSLVILGYSF